MSIEFHCPECFSQIITPDETAGKQGRCSHCSSVVRIPLENPAGKFTGPGAKEPHREQTPAPSGARNADPFKPTGNRTPVQAENPSIRKQFGFEEADLKPTTSSEWGEDPTMSMKMRKLVAEEYVKNRMFAPGHTLVVVAAINLIAVVIGIGALMIYIFQVTQNTDDFDPFWIVFWIIVIAVAMIVSTMIMIGGNHIKFGRSYSMAFTGVIFAMLPLNPLFFLTIPFAFWALSVLRDPKIAVGFKQR